MTDAQHDDDLSRPLSEGEPPPPAPVSSGTPEPASPAPSRRRTSLVRGAIVCLIGVLGAFLLMAKDGQMPHAALLGIAAMFVAGVGLADLWGMFSPRAGDSLAPLRFGSFFHIDGEPAFLAPAVTVPLSALILIVGGLAFGYAKLPYVIVAALLALLPSALRRPGLLVFLIATGVMLPMLGAYGLWDPWETHYGEVAREILSRDDWISLWWAQEDWFWSKPIFIFWAEGLTMNALGMDFHPDAHPLHPEWSLRIPVFLVALGAVMSVYAAVGRVFGKRAGAISAIVLATTPHFFLLSHQAITDMYFVGNMTTAMSMLVIALTHPPEDEARVLRWGPIAVSVQHVVLIALAMVALPQILYLVSRNISFVPSAGGFAWHLDTFTSGSAGNGDVPGNSPIHTVEPAVAGWAFQPIAQALYWLLGFVVIAWKVARERRVAGLAMVAFYLFCAFAFMSKGIPGFALPGLIALLYLIATRRWNLLWDGRLKVALGIGIVLVVGAPWFVAMYMRHGPAFTDRLLIHDHINRLAAGVHGDTGSIQYFLVQLGFGLFPWVALAPAALTAWLHMRSGRSNETPDPHAPIDPRRETLMLIALWFASAFVLFSAMITKFHHYIFPAVPPIAILVGVLLDRMFGARELGEPVTRRALRWGAAIFAPTALIAGVGGLVGDLRGINPKDANQTWVLEHPLPVAVCIALIVLGVAALAFAAYRLRSSAGEEQEGETAPSGWHIAGLSAALASAPVIAGFVGRDLSWAVPGQPAGYERLIHLFVYNYERPWPADFDYRPILTGFAVAAAAILLFAAVRHLRPIAARGLLVLACLFSVWSLDVYLVDLSPHWSQREVLYRYYDLRGDKFVPLLAWQMNWKGENFYTGNRVYVFVDLDNTKLLKWVDEHRGQKVYLMTEHSRLASLKSVLGRELKPISDMHDNNKFLIVETTL